MAYWASTGTTHAKSTLYYQSLNSKSTSVGVFMRNLFILIVIFFYSQSYIYGAQTCDEYLQTSSKNSQISVARQTQVAQMQNQVLNQSVLVKLMNAQLLQSTFFKFIAGYARMEPWSKEVDFRFESPEKIALLTDAQNNRLATLMYKIMKHEFEKNGDSVTTLSDPRLSQEVFFSLSKEEIIDKIGETLITIGMDKKYTVLAEDVSSRSKLQTAEEVAYGVGIVGTAFTSLFLFLSYLMPVDGLLLFNPTWQTFFGLSLATLVGTKLKHKIRSLRTPRLVLRDRLSAYDGITVDGTYTVEPSLDYVEGQYQKNIERLKEQILELTSQNEIPDPMNLLVFGRRAVQLHSELNLTFHTDFMRWMAIYDRNKDHVRNRIHDLRNGNLGTPEGKKEVLNFLSKMLQEASEATQATKYLSYQIIKIIQKDIDTLSSTVIDSNDVFLVSDFNRRKDFLSLALATHTQFYQSLGGISQTVSNLMQNLETLLLAESAVIIMDLGNAVRQLDRTNALDSILEGLREMDLYSERLKQLDEEIADAELVEVQ